MSRGELPEEQAEDLRRRSVDALSDALSRAAGATGAGGRGPEEPGDEHANDARLLADVPPHW